MTRAEICRHATEARSAKCAEIRAWRYEMRLCQILRSGFPEIFERNEGRVLSKPVRKGFRMSAPVNPCAHVNFSLDEARK